LRERLESGLSSTTPFSAARLRLRDLAFSSLATLTGPETCGGGELVAGVSSRFAGALRATALFAMEPEDALESLRAGVPEAEPLGAYTALGRSVSECVVSALAAGAEAGDAPGDTPAAGIRQEGDASLQEDSVIATLLATHAPSDTVIVLVGVDLLVAARSPSAPSEPSDAKAFEEATRAYVYILVEPKPFAALLGRAEASTSTVN